MADKATVGARIREARGEKSLTQQDVGKYLGITRAAVAQWESNVTSPSIATVTDVAKFLGTRPEWLAYGINTKTLTVEVPKEGLMAVPEIAFGEKPEQTIQVQEWDLPAGYVKGDLRAADAFIWTVETSMMTDYEHGDRVIVDRSVTKPSPAGVFLLWNGLGVELAFVSVQPIDGRLTARVSYDGGRTTAYEADPQKMRLLGRVRGVIKAL